MIISKKKYEMLITESRLRKIIREELDRSEKQLLDEQSPLAALSYKYLTEPEVEDLSALQKATYVNARVTLGSTPTEARAYALGKSDYGKGAISFDQGIIPTINPAAAKQIGDMLAPITDTTIYNVAVIFDPIAILSWPAFYVAWSRFSTDKSAANAMLLYIAALGCIPMMSNVLKGTRFITTALRATNAFTTVTKTSSTVQKIKAIAKCFASAPTKWVDLVSELAPYADKIAEQMSLLSKAGTKIDGSKLFRDLNEAASIIDRFNYYFKYIEYVSRGASENVQEFLIGRFGPKVEKSIDQKLAAAAAEVEKASGFKLPLVSSKPAKIS